MASRHISIDLVEAFLAVVTHGGLRSAARELGITSAGLHKRLWVLRTAFGVPLFTSPKSRGRLRLTDAGRLFKPYAEQLASTWQMAVTAVSPVEVGRQIELAAARSICAYVLPRMLAGFHRKHPDVRIIVKPGFTSQVLEMVLRGTAEIGLAYSVDHPEIETVRLMESPLVLVTAQRHPPEEMTLETLATKRMILFERGSQSWTLTTALFNRAGLTPRASIEADSTETAKRLVLAGLGYAFLPRLAIDDEPGLREIMVKRTASGEVRGSRIFNRSIDLISRKATPLSAEAMALRDLVVGSYRRRPRHRTLQSPGSWAPS
jgi:DNA-binding transcriptional LysR family regulator